MNYFLIEKVFDLIRLLPNTLYLIKNFLFYDYFIIYIIIIYFIIYIIDNDNFIKIIQKVIKILNELYEYQ